MSFVVRSETESLHLLALITAAVTPRPPFSAPRLFPAQKLLLCIPPSAAAQTLQQQAVHGEGGTTIVVEFIVAAVVVQYMFLDSILSYISYLL